MLQTPADQGTPPSSSERAGEGNYSLWEHIDCVGDNGRAGHEVETSSSQMEFETCMDKTSAVSPPSALHNMLGHKHTQPLKPSSKQLQQACLIKPRAASWHFLFIFYFTCKQSSVFTSTGVCFIDGKQRFWPCLCSIFIIIQDHLKIEHP